MCLPAWGAVVRQGLLQRRFNRVLQDGGDDDVREEEGEAAALVQQHVRGDGDDLRQDGSSSAGWGWSWRCGGGVMREREIAYESTNLYLKSSNSRERVQTAFGDG